MDSPRVLTAGRLRRLTEELLDERLGVIESTSSPEALVDELDYALRPPRHELRVPSYGSFVLPTRPIAEWNEPTGLEFFISEASERADDDVRRYADGVSSWTIRTHRRHQGARRVRPAGGIRARSRRAGRSDRGDDRAASSERARPPRRRVVRRRQVGWRGLAPRAADRRLVEAGQLRARPPTDTLTLDRFLRFAVHDLGARGVGTIIVYRPADPESPAFEQRLRDAAAAAHRSAVGSRTAAPRAQSDRRRGGVRRVRHVAPTRRAARGEPGVGDPRSSPFQRHPAHVGAAIQLRRSDRDPGRGQRTGTGHRAARRADHRSISRWSRASSSRQVPIAAKGVLHDAEHLAA